MGAQLSCIESPSSPGSTPDYEFISNLETLGATPTGIHKSSRQFSASPGKQVSTATTWTALGRPSDFKRASVELMMDFPMWLIPARTLLTLEGPLLPHDKMREQGLLTQWRDGHPRKVVLISHQWAGRRHPDPKGDQMRVLQGVLKDMAAGKLRVGKDTIAESTGTDVPMPSEEEQLNCLDWDIWYDFFGIPQVDDRGCVTHTPELQAAVDSIPAYCNAADFVIVLAPKICHSDTGDTMNYISWATRGWCRAERTAAALAAEPKPLLVVSGPSRIFSSHSADWMQNWPQDGAFTVEEDRATVQGLTKQLLQLKCDKLLQSGDVNTWRFYKAMMFRVIGSSGKHGSPFEDSDMESTNDSFHLETPRNQDTQRFQAIYQFSAHKPVQGRDASCHRCPARTRSTNPADGLSPLMIACVTGCCQTVRNLLREGADVNFTWEGCIKDAQLCGRHTALSIAAALSTPEIIEELLAAGAKPDISNDKLGNTPLGMAALFGNHAVIPALVEEGHEEVHRGNYLGHAPIVLAVTTQNAQVTDRLLRLKADPNQAGGSGGSVLAISCLHYSNIEHIKLLLKAGADPNLVVRSESMRRVSTRYMDNQLDVLFRKPGEACLESTGHALLHAGRPIHFAAMFGHIELVELLYKWGAEVTCEAGQCIQPVDLARAQGHQAVADFLLEAAGDEFFAV